MSTAGVNQFTGLFSNAILSRVEKLRLNASRQLTNRSRGEHLAGKGGSSNDFADFRNYVPGDDVRYVDWNVFSRSHRPYLKVYRHEEEMHVVLLVDASSSMVFDGKLERAKQLAGALAVMGLMNIERVSIYSCRDRAQTPALLPPCTGRASLRRMFQFLEGVEGGGNFPVDQAVQAILRRHRGRGMVVILSDFLTLGDLQRPMNMLYSAGLEIFGVQILSPVEIDPELNGDLRLVDSESGETLDVSSVGDLLGIYHEHRRAWQDELALLCRRRGGRFLSISSRDPLEWVLFDLLRRKGWIQ